MKRFKLLKKIKFFLFLNFFIYRAFCQNSPVDYNIIQKRADSLFKAKEYRAAVQNYSKYLSYSDSKSLTYNRLKLAGCWANLLESDSAFYNLRKIAFEFNYKSIDKIIKDSTLTVLWSDKRWPEIVKKVQSNYDIADSKLNKSLILILDEIYDSDQGYRKKLKGTQEKFGYESKELSDLWKTIQNHDSLNLIKVKEIIGKYGWLGSDVIGEKGNSTLFAVIQHSDLKTQETYLPMMQEAARNNNAKPSSLALLEDRIALGQGKKQIYGSQIGRDPVTNKNMVLALEDPDHVDERRAKVGLGPLSEYVKNFNFVWDLEQYKKDQKLLDSKN